MMLIALASCDGRKYKLPIKELQIKTADGKSISVMAEIASKQEERNFGYMERKVIPEGTGMLFVFEKEQMLSFWMKNTPTPLSIAYIDAKGQITDILDMKPFSLESIESSRSAKYALEVPQGWFGRNGVSQNDIVLVDEILLHK